MPEDLRALVTDQAKAAGLDPDFVSRLVQTESNWNPAAVGPALPHRDERAMGLMQVLPSTAKDYGVTDLLNARENIKAGIAYLKNLHQRYSGRQDLMAAAYNAGPGAVDKAGGVPNFAETQTYVRKVADPRPDVVIVDDTGDEHVFPPGFDPKRAAGIVRSRTTQTTAQQSKTPPKSGQPSTYLEDVARYGSGEVKGFVRGLTDLINPATYVETAKGVAAGIRDLPAYIKGFSMEDIKRAPGQAAEALSEFVQDPEAVGRLGGQIVAGKAGITPAGAVRAASATGRAVAPVITRAAPAVVKHGATVVGASVGGWPGAIVGREVGADLADALRARLKARAPVKTPATPTMTPAAEPPRPSLPSGYDRYMPNVSGATREATPASARTMTGPFAGGTGTGGERTLRDIAGDFPEGPGGLSSAGQIPKLPGPGKSPVWAMDVLRDASKAAKVELTAPETQDAIRLVQQGQSGKDVVEGIIQKRTLAQRLKQSPSFAGLADETEAERVTAARVAESNKRRAARRAKTGTKPTADELLKQYGGED